MIFFAALKRSLKAIHVSLKRRKYNEYIKKIYFTFILKSIEATIFFIHIQTISSTTLNKNL